MRASCVVRRASCALVLAACNPASTRPSFTPLPESLHAVINATPAIVTREAQALLTADSIHVRRSSERDAWLETNEFAGTHRLRLWADPDVPGKSRVTIEAVYRPLEDPSRTSRDLERAAEPGSAGVQRAARLLEALKDKLGVTTY
ncbi:MAG TPA: hypothetical protein VN513_01155 [Gemmatimonadales bacterium]|nr:hypothetical protein [Gemmatimonadales bacterium]